MPLSIIASQQGNCIVLLILPTEERKAQNTKSTPEMASISRPVPQPTAQPVPRPVGARPGAQTTALFKQVSKRSVTGITGGIKVSVTVGSIEEQEVCSQSSSASSVLCLHCFAATRSVLTKH